MTDTNRALAAFFSRWRTDWKPDERTLTAFEPTDGRPNLSYDSMMILRRDQRGGLKEISQVSERISLPKSKNFSDRFYTSL